MDFGEECNACNTMHDRTASIFLFPRFSASNEPALFDGKLLSAGGGLER